MDISEQCKRIINNCARELSYQSAASRQAGGKYTHSPYCPLIHVFWDGVSEGSESVVRDVFEELWPSGAVTGTLVEFMRGVNSPEQLRKELHARAIPLLQNPVMRTKSDIRVSHYVSLSSPQLEQNIDLICKLHTEPIPGLYGNMYPVVFLFNDFDFYNTQKGHDLIAHIHKTLAGIPRMKEVALGRTLRDNSLLRPEQEEENYRIAADISFLMSTAPNRDGEPSGLPAWMESIGDSLITASYQLMQKPNLRIAVVTLRTLLEKRMELAREKRAALEKEYAHQSATQFFSGMGLEQSRLDCIEKAFEEYVKPNLPPPSSLEPLYNWKRAGKTGSFEAANRETQGALQLFAQRYFTVSEHTLRFDADEIADRFSRELLEKADYLFAQEYFKLCVAYLDEVKPARSYGIYAGAVDYARIQLYEIMVPRLKSALLRRAEEAEQFSKILQSFNQMLFIRQEPQEVGLIGVDSYYELQAKNHLDSSRLIKELSPRANAEEALNGISLSFQTLVNTAPEIYRASLEQELDQRTERNSDGSTSNMIITTLTQDLSNSQRMMVMNVSSDFMRFFLFHGDARFGASLRQSSGLVKTDCMDRAERLELYRFQADSLIGRSDQA